MLSTVSDMRLALSSDTDISKLNVVWSSMSGLISKIGVWSLNHINVFADNFSPAAGKAMGDKWPYLAAGLVLWIKGAQITDLISLLEKIAK